MKRKLLFIVLLFASLFAVMPCTAGGGKTIDISALPRTITVNSQDVFHVQGIAVDLKKGYIYFSFTTKLLKCDLQGNLIGSVNGMLGHLGCLSFNPDNGRVYGSLEYKNDEIGKGIRNKLMPTADVETQEKANTGFYVAIFDADRITRPDMDAEKDRVMTTVFVKEAYEDYFGVIQNGGKSVKHRFGCSGIDGTTIAPAFGKKGKRNHIYLAYGVYGDNSRTDNDYQVILDYDIRKWKRYEQPLSQDNLHRSGPTVPDHKYFVRTGNTSYGIQNLAYDAATGNFYMAVYKGSKKEYPNYTLFVADGSVAPHKERLAGFDTQQDGEILSLLPAGKSEAGVRGWHFALGACGLCPLGNGYFYIVRNYTDKNGKQACTVRLYKWTGNEETPFVLVE